MAHQIAGSLEFAATHSLFRYHVPGHPCIPGSVIIEALRKQATALAGDVPLEARRFRFLHFAKPGRHDFAISRDETTGILHCRLGSEEAPLATGTFAPVEALEARAWR